MAKNKVKTPEAPKAQKSSIPTSGIAGILLMIVCVSIGYNVFLVLAGTEGVVNQIMAIPSVLFIFVFLALKAWK